MAYKFSKGDRGLGDIKFEDDSDTGIDFDQDRIDLETNGQTRLKVENTTTTITNTLLLEGSDIEALRIAKGDDDYKQIVFENDGVDSANIHLSNGENLVFQNETNGKDIQFWVNPTAGSTAQAMVIKEDIKVGIGTDTPSHMLDINGDIRVRGNDIRDNSGNPAITFDGSANTAVVNDLTVGGNVFDANNKSVIKLVDHGACLINESNTSERFLPDDIFHDYGGSNLYTTNAPPFSGSVDKLVVRGVNNSDLSLLGNLTAKVRIAGEGVDGYDIDTDNQCSNIESVTINSSDLGSNKNCVFSFTNSNFTPQDIYAITLTPTNNWTSITNGAYINFTIVTSYIID